MDREGDRSDREESPLTFSMPASLHEYMNRYMNVGGRVPSSRHSPAALSSLRFPTRHWLDDVTPGAEVPPPSVVPDSPYLRVPPSNSSTTWDNTPTASELGPPTFGSEQQHRHFTSSSRTPAVNVGRNSMSSLSRIDPYCDYDEEDFRGEPVHDRDGNGGVNVGGGYVRPPSRGGPRTLSRPRTHEIVRRPWSGGNASTGGLAGHNNGSRGDGGSGGSGGSGTIEEIRPSEGDERWPQALLSRHTVLHQVDERPMYRYGGGPERRAESAERDRAAGAEEGQRNPPSLDRFMREIAELIQAQRAQRAAEVSAAVTPSQRDVPALRTPRRDPREQQATTLRPAIAYFNGLAAQREAQRGQAQEHPAAVGHDEGSRRQQHDQPQVNQSASSTPTTRPTISERIAGLIQRHVEGDYAPLRANRTWLRPSPSQDTTQGGVRSRVPSPHDPNDDRGRSSPAVGGSSSDGDRGHADAAATGVPRALTSTWPPALAREWRPSRLQRPRQQSGTRVELSPAEEAISLVGSGRSVASDTIYRLDAGPSAAADGTATNSRGEGGRGGGAAEAGSGATPLSGRDGQPSHRERADTVMSAGELNSSWRSRTRAPALIQMDPQSRSTTATMRPPWIWPREGSSAGATAATTRHPRPRVIEPSINEVTVASADRSAQDDGRHSGGEPGNQGPQQQPQENFGAVVEVLSTGPPQDEANGQGSGSTVEESTTLDGRVVAGDAPGLTVGAGTERPSEFAGSGAGRRWETDRNPQLLRIQGFDAEAPAVESPQSDGTLALVERHSERPSPREFAGGSGSDGVPLNGRHPPNASDVEVALFKYLTCLGVRRLLFKRWTGVTSAASSANHRPAWLEEWFHNGAPVPREQYTGSRGDESRCPRVGDVWELLGYLLEFWAEKLCAVARAPSPATQPETAESVKDLRELGEHIMPLDHVRSFIVAVGGPTPRDAVLLKTLLVMHEGIDWATGSPLHRHYRDEVIPTALALYSCLAQDTLEGVDLEVGHTLPQIIFTATDTTRPSWPRWGANTHSSISSNTIAGGSGSGGTLTSNPRSPLLSDGTRGRIAAEDDARRTSRGGLDASVAAAAGAAAAAAAAVAAATGLRIRHTSGVRVPAAGSARSRFLDEFERSLRLPAFRNSGGYDDGVDVSAGEEFGEPSRPADSHSPDQDNGDSEDPWGSGDGGGVGFVPGPWLVFYVEREKYIQFYLEQASALDHAVLGIHEEDVLC